MSARFSGVGARSLANWHVAMSPERGATMVEYGVMVALIATISIAVVTTIGADVRDAFRWVEHRLP